MAAPTGDALAAITAIVDAAAVDAHGTAAIITRTEKSGVLHLRSSPADIYGWLHRAEVFASGVSTCKSRATNRS